MRRLSLPMLALLAGCAHTVQVELPAMPSVAITTQSVAVVTRDRACRDVADALIRELSDMGAVRVDPRSEVRLEVFGCEKPNAPVTVDVELGDDGVDRRKVSVEGRAHAVLAVRVGDGTEAHLIGAARREVRGNGVEKNVATLSRAVDRELTEAVAADLAEQIRPVPRTVDRRIYPNAPSGTALALHTLAVDAERAGKIVLARSLAQAAYDEDPSEKHREYLEELDAILARWPAAADTTASTR